jgi:CheY-like chemotaxis protein
VAERAPKILVVDDVPENVRLLEAVLVSRGYGVVTANDGRAALERSRRLSLTSSSST